MIAWSLWLNRNAFLHEGKVLSSPQVLSRADYLWAQFLQCQPAAALKINHLPSPSRWNAPPSGCIKIILMQPCCRDLQDWTYEW